MENDNYRLERRGLDIVSTRNGFIVANPANNTDRVFESGIFISLSAIYLVLMERVGGIPDTTKIGYTIKYIHAGRILDITVDTNLDEVDGKFLEKYSKENVYHE